MSVSDGQSASAAIFNAAFADINFQTIAAGSNFTIVNSQGSAASVTGLLMDKTAYRSRVIEWQVYRKSTGGGGQTRIQRGRCFVWHDDTNWFLTQESMSSIDAGLVLDINSSTGQVTYTSDDNGGTYDSTKSVLTYQIVQTMRL